MQRNWLTTVKAKEVESTASNQGPTPTQPAGVPAAHYPNLSLSSDTKYCEVCIPLGRLCPNKYPLTLD